MSSSVMVLTVSVLNPSLRLLLLLLNPSLRLLLSSCSSAVVGVGVEKFDEFILVGSAEDWSVELSEQVSSSDSSW